MLRAARGVAETELEDEGRGRLEDQPPHCRAIKEDEATALEVGLATEDEYQALPSRATTGAADTLGVAEDSRELLEDHPPHCRAAKDEDATTLEVGVATEDEYQALASRSTMGAADTLGVAEDGTGLLEDQPPH